MIRRAFEELKADAIVRLTDEDRLDYGSIGVDLKGDGVILL